MSEPTETKPTAVKRIGGYLHRVIPIADKSGQILSYALKPLMVEFQLRDIFQVIVGACILAIPVCLTEEVWVLGEVLPLTNVLLLSALSLLIVGTFVRLSFYGQHIAGHRIDFIKRVLGTYLLSLLTVGLILTILQKCPWQADFIIALKRVIIVAFPASMSATISDSIK